MFFIFLNVLSTFPSIYAVVSRSIYANFDVLRIDKHFSTYLLRSNFTTLIRSFGRCSTDEYLKEELEHIRTVFHHRNNYALWVINKVIDGAKKIPSSTENDSSSNDKIHRLMLPYQGNKVNWLKSMERYVSELLPEHTKIEITLFMIFHFVHLNSCFSIKDKTVFKHSMT